MQAWSQTFGQIKEQYIKRSLDRIARLLETLSSLANSPNDLELINKVAREFHGMAGSGTIYGYPNVSLLGGEGEDYCNSLLRDTTRTVVADVEKLRGLVSQIAQEFTLPESQVETTNIVSKLPVDRRNTKPEILVIDENQTDLQVLCRLVEEGGYAVRSARSMQSALIELTRNMPSGLIIEIPLPDGDAYELVEHVRGLEGGESLAILIVSKQIGFLDKVRSIHCGADAHFEKPVDTKAMLRRLRYLLDKQRQDAPRILSVEDDPDQAAFIRAFLESAGYLVKTCTDPRNFESYLSSFNPDLVLLDVMLPGMTGYELAKYLRQDERHATLPVLFLTTQNNLESRIEAARAGGDDHLVKPVAPALLLSSVSARLERARFLKTLLHKDGLTHLLNHSAFMEQAQMVISQQKPSGTKSAIILIDVDYFKSINERHGYPGGDKVLVSLSLLLHKRLRQSDIIGRYSGDRFAIIGEGLDEQEALALAGRLLADFAATSHSTALHAGFYATCSAGIAVLDPKSMSVDNWLGAATNALEAAKKAGRNCALAARGNEFIGQKPR